MRLSHFKADVEKICAVYLSAPPDEFAGFHKAAIEDVRVDDAGGVRILYSIFRDNDRHDTLCLARTDDGWTTLSERCISRVDIPETEFLRERACFFGYEANWPNAGLPSPLAAPATHLRLSARNANGDFAGVSEVGHCDGPLIDGYRAVRISHDGLVTRLGTLGGRWSFGLGISNSGAVVGVSETGDRRTAPFFWSETAGMDKLPIESTDPSRAWDGYPIDVDQAGNVVVGRQMLRYICAFPEARANAEVLIGPRIWIGALSLSPSGRYLALANDGWQVRRNEWYVQLIELDGG